MNSIIIITNTQINNKLKKLTKIMGCKCSDIGNKDRQMDFEDDVIKVDSDLKNKIDTQQNPEQNQTFNNGVNNTTAQINSIFIPDDKLNHEEEHKKKKKRHKYDFNLYPNDVIMIINNIREDPSKFVPDVENAINNIKNEKGRLIYAGALKVALNEGEKIFNEAAEFLKKSPPMKPLVMDESIVIACPQNEEDIKNTKFFQKKIIEKKKECNLDAYFKDSIVDPYISVLLAVIDDSGKNTGKKRNAVLNREFTRVGISVSKVGKIFCAYYTFAK